MSDTTQVEQLLGELERLSANDRGDEESKDESITMIAMLRSLIAHDFNLVRAVVDVADGD